MPWTQSDFSPELRSVKVSATSEAFWLGISAAATLSSDPAPCGLARWTKATTARSTSTPPMAINKSLAGVRLRLAVPNSSPMLIVGPRWAAGAGVAATGGGTGAGVGIGSGMIAITILLLATLRRRSQLREIDRAL